MAGAPGFEPGNGGIKIRCLTTWLRPIRRARPYRRPLHRSTSAPLELRSRVEDCRKARRDDRCRVLLLNRLARLGPHALAQAGVGKLAQRLGPFLGGLREETVDAVAHHLPV